MQQNNFLWMIGKNLVQSNDYCLRVKILYKFKKTVW